MSDSAIRALRVLEHLALAPNGLTRAEIATTLGESRSTIGRLLASLEQSGWVTSETESNRFRPSLRLVVAGSAALRHDRVHRQLQPWLIQLSETTGAPCALCFYADGRVTVTALTEKQAERTVARPEAYALPGLVTAAGKLLVAFQPRDAIERMVNKQKHQAFTPYTVTDPVALMEQINSARDKGYATADREFNLDTSAIAVPVFDRPGHAVAALGVNQLGPLTQEFVEEVVPKALSVAALASSSIGTTDVPSLVLA